MANIQETKELVKWVCTLANAIGVSMKDGKISIGDLYNFMGVLSGASTAFAGADKIPEELLDLTDAEKAEVLALVEKEFQIPNDQVEAYVKAGLQAASKLHDVYLLFKKLREGAPA